MTLFTVSPFVLSMLTDTSAVPNAMMGLTALTPQKVSRMPLGPKSHPGVSTQETQGLAEAPPSTPVAPLPFPHLPTQGPPTDIAQATPSATLLLCK